MRGHWSLCGPPVPRGLPTCPTGRAGPEWLPGARGPVPQRPVRRGSHPSRACACLGLQVPAPSSLVPTGERPRPGSLVCRGSLRGAALPPCAPSCVPGFPCWSLGGEVLVWVWGSRETPPGTPGVGASPGGGEGELGPESGAAGPGGFLLRVWRGSKSTLQEAADEASEEDSDSSPQSRMGVLGYMTLFL